MYRRYIETEEKDLYPYLTHISELKALLEMRLIYLKLVSYVF